LEALAAASASAFDTNAATILSIILRVQLVNSRRVHVGCRGNGAYAAVAHVGQQERFATHKHVEGASRTGGWSRTGGFSERVEKSFGVIPIARAVFHPGDCIRISRKKPLEPEPPPAQNRFSSALKVRIPQSFLPCRAVASAKPDCQDIKRQTSDIKHRRVCEP